MRDKGDGATRQFLRVVSGQPIVFCLALMLDCTFDLLVEEESGVELGPPNVAQSAE